jgi:NTP-dependent ternary system trypsin peptidase co-occuring protein
MGGRNSDGDGDHAHRHLVAVAVAQLIEFPVGGQSVLVQVENTAAGPVTRGIGGAQSVAARASQTFEEAISRVQPAAEAIVAQLRSLATASDEVEVESGLALSAEAGAFIAAASTEANFKLTLTWRRLPRRRPSDGDRSGPPAEFPCPLRRGLTERQEAAR